MERDEKYIKELVAIFQKISGDRKLLKEFLADLLTPSEYQEIGKRWQIIKLLERGISQRKIAKNLKVSIATVTRGSRELRDNEGGFKKTLEKYCQR